MSSADFRGAFKAGSAVFDLAQGCLVMEAYLEALQTGSDKAFPHLIENKITRSDGTVITYDLGHYLRRGKSTTHTSDNLRRAWYSGAILNCADLLDKGAYFDHCPEFELVYHLRNGIAHGNVFNINANGQKRLSKYAAHLRDFQRNAKFPIGSALQKTSVLFDFIAPADIYDLLTIVAERLRNLERGILGHGVHTSAFG